MENTQDKNKRKKRAIIIAALIAVPGLLIAGVFASNTTISINNDSPISLGAGYTTATTCDDAVTVSAVQSYQGTAFKVETLTVSGIGEATCAGKTLSLVYVVSGTANTATYTITTPSPSASDRYSIGHPTLASFALNALSTIAVGIS
jgi:hypothetical protein